MLSRTWILEDDSSQLEVFYVCKARRLLQWKASFSIYSSLAKVEDFVK